MNSTSEHLVMRMDSCVPLHFLSAAVCYLGSMEAFASCSSSPQSSLVIGWREEDSRSVRLTTFATKRGVWDMDHHRELNLIGGDKSILWVPNRSGLTPIWSHLDERICSCSLKQTSEAKSSVVAATAGLDHWVLLWNPCVTSEPVCVLRGHTSPITAVCFIQSRQELFSYSKDKVCV